MASGSLKDLGKALANALSSPSYPEKDLDRVTHAFLEKHQDINDQDSQRLHEELLQLYQKYVADNVTKQPTFLRSLRRLRPAIHGSDRLLDWWQKLLKPCLVSLELRKTVLADVREIVLSVLVYEGDEEGHAEGAKTSILLTRKLLELYLERTKLPSSEADSATGPEQEKSKYVSNHLESLLVDFGKKAPEHLLAAIDAVVVKKDSRLQALSLLSTIVRHQPPHLYQILQTELLGHLLQCLLVDTSTTAVSLALTSLVMLLPHIPNSLVPHLPQLFTIYSRVLCWERFRPTGSDERTAEANGGGKEVKLPLIDSKVAGSASWEKLHYSFDTADSTTPNLSHYFTFLYGLYPLNFMAYVRKPSKYLRDAKSEPSLDLDLDQSTIRHRTEQFHSVHLLHPNFYSLTIDSELTDLSRFTKNDPADIVAECMGLRLTFTSALKRNTESPNARAENTTEAYVPTEDIPTQTLLSNDEDDTNVANGRSSPSTGRRNSSWRNTQSTAVGSHSSVMGDGEPLSLLRRSSQNSNGYPSSRSNENPSQLSSPKTHSQDHMEDSPTIPPQYLVKSPSDAKLNDMLQTHESLRTSVHLSHTNESVNSLSAADAASPRLDAYIQTLSNNTAPRSPAIHPTVPGARTNVAFLQREVILLRNDLNFERYLKQQHLSHIGQLQRRRIAEATVEAETLNLINNSRVLKNRLEDAKGSYAMLKKETTVSKSHSMKWENELNNKYRALREDQKKWKDEEKAIRSELQKIRKERDELRGSVMQSDSKDLFSKQRLQIVQHNADELQRLRTEVEKLTVQLRNMSKVEANLQLSKQREERALAQVQTSNMKLSSRDAERERLKRAYDHKISALESHIQSLRSPMPTQAPQALQAMLDSALDTSNSRLTHMKTVYNRLLERYTELEIKHIELQALADMHGLTKTRNKFDSRGNVAVRSHSHGDDSNSASRFHSPTETAGMNAGHRRDHSNLSSSAPMSTNFPPPPGQTESLSGHGSPHSDRNGDAIYGEAHVGGSTSLRPHRSLPEGSGSGSGSSHSADVSPTKIKANSDVRVFGRGGVQNIGKKEKKDKDKDKEKKSIKPGLALKGIRGFG
ncbi:MAG: hypothetical protein M1837_007093 [Sclerophora amabilis]|nr:MAG: hypothetical protein M1837_007093 [Sclerophora amabilis]